MADKIQVMCEDVATSSYYHVVVTVNKPYEMSNVNYYAMLREIQDVVNKHFSCSTILEG